MSATCNEQQRPDRLASWTHGAGLTWSANRGSGQGPDAGLGGLRATSSPCFLDPTFGSDSQISRCRERRNAGGRALLLPGVCTSGLTWGARYMVGPSFLQSCILALPSHVPRSQRGPARQRASPASLLCLLWLPPRQWRVRVRATGTVGHVSIPILHFCGPTGLKSPHGLGLPPYAVSAGKLRGARGPARGAQLLRTGWRASERREDPSQSDVYGANTCRQQCAHNHFSKHLLGNIKITPVYR